MIFIEVSQSTEVHDDIDSKNITTNFSKDGGNLEEVLLAKYGMLEKSTFRVSSGDILVFLHLQKTGEF